MAITRGSEGQSFVQGSLFLFEKAFETSSLVEVLPWENGRPSIPFTRLGVEMCPSSKFSLPGRILGTVQSLETLHPSAEARPDGQKMWE